MHLAGGIGDDAGGEGQEIADVNVGGVGNVDDLRNVHGLLVGDLLRVDAGRGGMDVDLLLDELDAGERYAEGGLCGIDVVGGGLVEARLFDAQLIGFATGGASRSSVRCSRWSGAAESVQAPRW